MSPRKEFLLALFRVLDRKAVPYCVLRNYANIYEDPASDVDVVVEPQDVLRFKDCLAEAAAASNHHLVLRARYTNYSYVYWHPEGKFIRVDIEAEVRWRSFPVLTAKAVVGLRRREGAFYIPHPRHESAILWVAAIWRGELSDRYRNQLAQLCQQEAAPGEYERTFNASFGMIGPALAACQSRIMSQTFDPRFWNTAKWSIVKNAFRDRPCRRALLGFIAGDVKRLPERIRNPRGISILYASSAQSVRDLIDLFQQIKFLYPIQKSDLHSFALSPANGAPSRSPGFGCACDACLCCSRAVCFCVSTVSRATPTSRASSRRTPAISSRPGRSSGLRTLRSTLAWATSKPGSWPSRSHRPELWSRAIRLRGLLPPFFERYPARGEPRPRRRGAFIVLVGLDASGRNPIARSLCSLALTNGRFNRVRYLRWPPRLRHESLFPLPELDHLPDQPRLGDKPRSSRLPILQVCMNLLLANLGNWLRLRPLLRRNSLVLFDGYDYDYLLDPAAVKGFGRARLLARLLSLYPRPDLVVVLKAPAAALRSRKQASSEGEILNQTAVFEQLGLDSQRTLEVDASSPPLEIARAILQKIAAIIP